MSTSQTLSADWTQVLARVETALTQAIARIDDRAQALAAAGALPQTPRALNFSKFDEYLATFASRPQHAQQKLTDLHVTLREGEDALRNWLARAEATRRQLATLAGRAVG